MRKQKKKHSSALQLQSTLHLKLIFVYLIFGFLSIFTVATLTSSLTFRSLKRTTAERMYQNATILASDYFPSYFSEEITEHDLDVQLNAMNTYMGASIWLVNPDGTLIYSNTPATYPTAPNSIRAFNPAEAGGKLYIEGNYHDYFSSDVLTVIAPVTQEFTRNGYLVMHKKIDDLRPSLQESMTNVYITLAVIFLLSFVFLLAFQFLVYRPLRKITEAATQYASGNLDYEIPVKTEDEMGYLSASLNYMSSHLKDMKDYQKKFVANVSHDFRSPLTSIKGYVEAIADGTIPPELHGKYLKIILFETERLTDLTRDLLTLNEFDTEHLLLNKSSFDIHEAIKHTAATFEGRCTQKKISIELLFATKKLMVYADQRKIQQVLYNLIDNAIKFSDMDSIITVETYERGDKVFVSVKDYGCGIPRESLNKIWERFYKTDASRGKDKKGTGLGLAIVKEALHAHEENITVISTQGVGTEFIFSLPSNQKKGTLLS